MFVYSYCYAIFSYNYIIAGKILNFSATVEIIYFKVSGVKNLVDLTRVLENCDFRLLDLIFHEKDFGGEKIWRLISDMSLFCGKWCY